MLVYWFLQHTRNDFFHKQKAHLNLFDCDITNKVSGENKSMMSNCFDSYPKALFLFDFRGRGVQFTSCCLVILPELKPERELYGPM